ncbi:MAG: glycosyltransferase family 2 protein, partial [Treponema sp.]|nr:glycosyltransferase family 2 protein [Treponema sp.]
KPLPKQAKEPPRYIVTLTSYGRRVAEKAPRAIRSLFKQTTQPDRIVLWLAHGTKIPKALNALQDAGLEIRFCEDIKSYTKLLPALSAFPNDALITADDDIFYPPDWFKALKEAFIRDPSKIHCHRAHEIYLDNNNAVLPYSQWGWSVKTATCTKRLFPTGVGGILYPPHTFNDEIFRKDMFQTLSPTADDIWFWAMALHNGKEFALVENGMNDLINVGINNDGLWRVNVGNNKNDEQMQQVLRAYPDVYERIL